MADHSASAEEHLVLHALRCLGHTSVARLSDAIDHPGVDVEDALLGLGARGWVTGSSGPWGGWGLTPEGRAADAALTAAELDATSERATIEALYGRFEVLNPGLLETSTAWQLRPGPEGPRANDHADPYYDARVLQRLRRIDREAQPVCHHLAVALPRFQPYGRRLGAALARAEGGVLGAVCDDLDSYHSVWFQLHEDLLTTLGRPRW